MQSTEMMFLPVEQLHSRVNSLLGEFAQERGTSYSITIVFDREALELQHTQILIELMLQWMQK